MKSEETHATSVYFVGFSGASYNILLPVDVV
jgi:hypothetical protein